MADDDFRTKVQFEDDGGAEAIADHLHSQQVAAEMREALGDHLIVTRDGKELFLYSGSEQDGRAAAEAITKLIEGRDLRAEVGSLERWHPIEHAWKDASVAEPTTDAEIAAEHASWEEREAADSLEDNLAEWEVRIELDSHGDAVDLAKKLEAEGVSPIVRRWKYLLVGAVNEDSANELGARLRAELPTGAKLTVEPAPAWIYEGASKHPIRAMFGIDPPN